MAKYVTGHLDAASMLVLTGTTALPAGLLAGVLAHVPNAAGFLLLVM